MALTTDPIISSAAAQRVFDVTDEEELVRLINSISARARTFMGRVQLIEILGTPIIERLRGPASEMLFLHAPVNVSDFDTYPLTVKYYSRGVVARTYTAKDLDVIVTSDDYSSRVDNTGGCFPELSGGDYHEVEYVGGWNIVPGDVFAGAILQRRVELKRMRGEVGMANHSASGESVGADQAGIIKEVADMWQMYRILI